MRKSPRQRRLEADFRSVEELDAESSIFSFLASGDPPTRYRLHFDGPGISRTVNGKIGVVEKHEVIVELGASYPRMVPNLLWQTPIFHPNISNNGVVCLGGYGTHWVPSLTLDEMSTMLWDMIRYKNFDIQSPYNREAALWARDQGKFSFPLDVRDIRDLVNNPKTPSHQFHTAGEQAEESKLKNGKSVLGVFGALANRFRDRTNQSESADVSQVEHVSEEVAAASAVDVEVDAAEVDAVEVASEPEIAVDDVRGAEESVVVDPSEIEVITDGIAFLDSEGNNQASATKDRIEDTGIVFLD